MPYPTWSYFPRNSRPPQWVADVVAATAGVERAIHTRVAGRPKEDKSSDAVLAKLAPGLQALGFNVETGKSKAQKISKPVLFGDDGKAQVTYEVDAFHDGLGVAVEVEAGRGAQNGADYRDIVRTSLLLDADFLAIWMPITYHFLQNGRPQQTLAYANTRSTLEAIYASGRLSLPFEGVLVVGY